MCHPSSPIHTTTKMLAFLSANPANQAFVQSCITRAADQEARAARREDLNEFIIAASGRVRTASLCRNGDGPYDSSSSTSASSDTSVDSQATQYYDEDWVHAHYYDDMFFEFLEDPCLPVEVDHYLPVRSSKLHVEELSWVNDRAPAI